MNRPSPVPSLVGGADLREPLEQARLVGLRDARPVVLHRDARAGRAGGRRGQQLDACTEPLVHVEHASAERVRFGRAEQPPVILQHGAAPGGIDPETVGHAGGLGLMAEHALGQRRAADIAKADEQDRGHARVLQAAVPRGKPLPQQRFSPMMPS